MHRRITETWNSTARWFWSLVRIRWCSLLPNHGLENCGIFFHFKRVPHTLNSSKRRSAWLQQKELAPNEHRSVVNYQRQIYWRSLLQRISLHLTRWFWFQDVARTNLQLWARSLVLLALALLCCIKPVSFQEKIKFRIYLPSEIVSA